MSRGGIRDVAYDAPDELGSALVFLTGPPEEFVPAHLQGTTVVGIAALWAGDVDEGAEAIRPFRELAPEVDLVGPMPYADFQCMIDDPPGLHNYWSADYHDDVPRRGARRLREVRLRAAVPVRPADPRSVGRRDRPGRRGRHADDEARRCRGSPIRSRCGRTPPTPTRTSSGRGRSAATSPATPSGGVYLNFIGDEGEDRVRAAYGDEKYRRLAAIKGEWDPTNVLPGQPEHQARLTGPTTSDQMLDDGRQ